MNKLSLLICAGTLAVTGCTETSTSDGSPTQTQPVAVAASYSSEAEAAAANINAARAQRGLSALTIDPRLMAAAQSHSNYMAQTGKFSHTGQGGSSVRTRVNAQGYSGCFWAENIASGYSTGQQVATGWMNSPKHRDNILNRRAAAVGVGKAGTMWTAVFAAPC